MTRPSFARFPLILLLAFAAGCGTAPTTTHPPREVTPVTPPPLVTPPGWLDFSADSSRNALMWLVKKDYGAEIVMEKIFDAPASAEGPGDAGQIESITRAIFLIDKGRNRTVLQEPERSESGGHVRWDYLVQNPAGERMRVVVGETMRYGLVRCAASIRQADDFHDVARVQDTLFEGPLQ